MPGETRVVSLRDDGLALVMAALDAGEVVAIPTDTVYGLAARVDRPAGIAAIFTAKGRPPGLALPVLVGRSRQVHEVAETWPRLAKVLTARFWPGPLTVVVPARPEIGPFLGGDGRTVGLRCPAHRDIRRLCRLGGPLAVTSANRHREPPCTTVRGGRRRLLPRSVGAPRRRRRPLRGRSVHRRRLHGVAPDLSS